MLQRAPPIACLNVTLQVVHIRGFDFFDVEFIVSTRPFMCGIILSITRGHSILGDVKPVWLLGQLA